MQFIRLSLSFLFSCMFTVLPILGRVQIASVPSGRIDSLGIEMSALPALNEENLDSVLDLVAATGVSYIRQEFNWTWIETSPDVYDWSAAIPLDRLVSTASAHGIQVVAVLTGGPAYLAAEGQPVDRPAFRDRWAKFVQAAVNHFGESVDIWEIGESPNSDHALSSFLYPLSPQEVTAPNPAFYAKLLNTAAKIIRQADPNDQIWLGSLTGLTAETCAMNPLTFILEIHGAKGWNDFDAIPYVPDQGSAAPEEPSSGSVNSACASSLTTLPNSMGDELTEVQELARQLGGKTVLVTGLGWNEQELDQLSQNRQVSPDQVEADLLVRATAMLTGENVIPIVFWHSDLSANLSSRNSIHNLQQALHHNIRPLGSDKTSDPALRVYRFRNGGKTTLLAWRIQDGDEAVPVALIAGDIPSFTVWAADSSDLSPASGNSLQAGAKGKVGLNLSERPQILIGRSGDVAVMVRQILEDQVQLLEIEARSLAERLLNEAKKEAMILLEKEWGKAKDSALEWGEDQLNELFH